MGLIGSGEWRTGVESLDLASKLIVIADHLASPNPTPEILEFLKTPVFIFMTYLMSESPVLNKDGIILFKNIKHEILGLLAQDRWMIYISARKKRKDGR